MGFSRVGRDINRYYQVFLSDGDIFKAYEKAKELGAMQINITPKDLEFILILKFLRTGFDENQICKMLEVKKARVIRIKKDLKKYKDIEI